MINFCLGFLCCAVVFYYVNWRTRKPEDPPTLVGKMMLKPDNKKARKCSTDAYRAEQRWLREREKKSSISGVNG